MLKNTKNGGSNEPPKFFLDILLKQCYNIRVEISGCSLVVELQPSKLIVWVRFPSSAPKKQGHRKGVLVFLVKRIGNRMSGSVTLHPSRAAYVWQNLTVMHAPERGVNRRY